MCKESEEIRERRKMMASLERNRYQPRFDQRVAGLPLYLDEEVQILKKFAEEDHWTLDRTSYTTNQDHPLSSCNSFYEYLDEYHDTLVDLLLKDIDDMPLYVNAHQPCFRAVAKWRMKIGK